MWAFASSSTGSADESAVITAGEKPKLQCSEFAGFTGMRGCGRILVAFASDFILAIVVAIN
jgi:hypothetical protein